MRIRITKSGIFRNGTDMIPVGTELDVPDDFSAWANKWTRVDSPSATLEVATPAAVPGNAPLGEVDEPEVDEELEAARNEYERVFGEKPHGRMKAETIRARIAEAE